MIILKTTLLFLLTAVFEIIGCYLPYLCLKENKPIWLLVPAGISLSLFVWLLTFHPTSAGRTYAAYGGAYVGVAIFWLWIVEGIKPDRWDLVGAFVAFFGMGIIMFMPRT